MPSWLRRSSSGRSPVREILFWVLLGVAIRLALLLAAGDLRPVADERNYVYLALFYDRFSFFTETTRFLWPPGYPWFLAVFLGAFGAHGIFLAKIAQVALSGITGACIVLMARSLWGKGAIRVAGLLWCLYLPLAAYSHYNWSEALLLPPLTLSLLLLLQGLRAPGDSALSALRWAAAGGLFGLSLLVKEVGLALAPLLAVVVAGLLARRCGWAAAARRALIFTAACVAVFLPWTLRNLEVYARCVPLGATVGENAYWGLNGLYRNFDLTYTPREDGALPRTDPIFTWFVAWEPGSAWERADASLGAVERSRRNLRRGLAYAWNHKGWFVRTRVRKVADWVTPLSFFVRHERKDLYTGPLGWLWVKRLLVPVAVASTLLVLAMAVPGFILHLPDRESRILFGAVIAYFAGTAMMVSMSRFRVPVEPLLIVLAAGHLARRGRDLLVAPGTRRALWISWACLGALWIINYADTIDQVRRAWR